jgi:hypothetical protein
MAGLLIISISVVKSQDLKALHLSGSVGDFTSRGSFDLEAD